MCLFVRPTPFGVPYVGDWSRYFFRALLYEWLQNYLIALPFLVAWLALFTRPLKSPALRWIHAALAAALALSLFLSEFDHEIMRFVGTRATPSYLQVYANAGTSWPIVFDALLLDKGGPLLPVALWIGAPLGFLWWAKRGPTRRLHATSRGALGLAVASVCIPLLVPIYVRQYRGGKGPTRRVDPLILSVARDLRTSTGPVVEPADFAELVRQHRESWLAEDADGRSWRFTSERYPYLREPVSPAAPPAPAGRWNVVVFQLETFRAWNVGLMRPELTGSPTPFLDALGRSDRGAYWTRHSSFGPPTVNGFMAWSCSLLPHSRELALTTFTYTGLDCLPDAARRHGYRAEVFTGFDPDWDNETLWYRRWYDQFHYYHDAAGDDQVLARHTAARLKELGRSPQPFLATVVGITNHYPFSSIDAAQDVAGHATPAERILNTMHYDDTAIRDFINALHDEPWFDRTLFVFLGDHGFNLGEHSASPGMFNLYRESTWVPLVLAGSHPLLKTGRHDEPASLLDVAPTVAELIGIREATPWLGHSLLAAAPPEKSVTFMRDEVTFGEMGDYSLVVDPDTETPRVFDATADPLQHRNVVERAPSGFVEKMLHRAERQRRLNDYLLRSSRIFPRR